jgi:hypothetical protein
VVLDQKESQFLSKVGVTSSDFLRSAVEIPSQNIINMADDAFKKTESTGNEHGFVVATDGTTSDQLTDNSPDYVKLGPGYDELESQGKQTSFDVHTHPSAFKPTSETNYEAGNPNPSGTPGITGPGDYGYRLNKETNGQVTQPSWVLGYQTTAISKNGKLTPSFTKTITTYNNAGVKYQTTWNTFKYAVNTVKYINHINR